MNLVKEKTGIMRIIAAVCCGIIALLIFVVPSVYSKTYLDFSKVTTEIDEALKQVDVKYGTFEIVQPMLWITVAALVAAAVLCIITSVKKEIAFAASFAANVLTLVDSIFIGTKITKADSVISSILKVDSSGLCVGFYLIAVIAVVGAVVSIVDAGTELNNAIDNSGIMRPNEKGRIPATGRVLLTIKSNPIAVILVIAAIVVGCIVDNFFSWPNLSNLLSNTAVRFLIALGVSGCLITKGTDLSAGRQVGLAACLSGILCQRADYTGRLWKSVPEMNIFLVLLIVVAIGFVMGLINGLIITKLRVPPFIATLGTQTIIYGIALVLTDAQPIGGFQKIYTKLITGRIGNVRGFHIPYLAFVALVFGLLFWFIYNKTRHGKYMYAIGGNEVAAEVSGVNTAKTTTWIYVTAGVMYAIAGYLLAAKSGGSSASMGSGYELEAIAGCTIGGVSTTGGIGTVPGILVGVLVFELLKIILQFLSVNPYYNYIVQGLVIVIAVALDIRKYLAKK